MNQPCNACNRLAGEPASVDPHPRLTLERAGALLGGDAGAGAVERYRCSDCGSLMLRFSRAAFPQGGSGVGAQAWRLVPPSRGPVGVGGTGGTG